jgi:hypothetical protein
MAFQRRRQQGKQGGNPPTLSVALSVKQGKGYIKGPSFGFWPNEEGGPAYRGTLKDDYLTQVLEFLSNAAEANLPVSMAVFDNSQDGPSKGGFKKPGFQKPGGGFKKPNPFKQQEEGEEQEEPGF